jgi:hypothetical protein
MCDKLYVYARMGGFEVAPKLLKRGAFVLRQGMPDK